MILKYEITEEPYSSYFFKTYKLYFYYEQENPKITLFRVTRIDYVDMKYLSYLEYREDSFLDILPYFEKEYGTEISENIIETILFNLEDFRRL